MIQKQVYGLCCRAFNNNMPFCCFDIELLKKREIAIFAFLFTY